MYKILFKNQNHLCSPWWTKKITKNKTVQSPFIVTVWDVSHFPDLFTYCSHVFTLQLLVANWRVRSERWLVTREKRSLGCMGIQLCCKSFEWAAVYSTKNERPPRKGINRLHLPVFSVFLFFIFGKSSWKGGIHN